MPSAQNNTFHACDIADVTPTCPIGQFITSGSLQFGRWDNYICPGPGVNSTTPVSFDVYNLPYFCLQGVSSCIILSDFLTKWFGDPLPGVAKHVSIELINTDFFYTYVFLFFFFSTKSGDQAGLVGIISQILRKIIFLLVIMLKLLLPAQWEHLFLPGRLSLEFGITRNALGLVLINSFLIVMQYIIFLITVYKDRQSVIWGRLMNL